MGQQHHASGPDTDGRDVHVLELGRHGRVDHALAALVVAHRVDLEALEWRRTVRDADAILAGDADVHLAADANGPGSPIVGEAVHPRMVAKFEMLREDDACETVQERACPCPLETKRRNVLRPDELPQDAIRKLRPANRSTRMRPISSRSAGVESEYKGRHTARSLRSLEVGSGPLSASSPRYPFLRDGQ